MNIVIIGTGNVASVLGRMIISRGHKVMQVFGRNRLKAERLAAELDASPCNDWMEISKRADLYLVAISDDALAQLPSQLSLNNQLIVHTAASVPMNILSGVSSNYGIVYPLQTIKRETELFTEIPFLVDGSNQVIKEKLFQFALELSGTVKYTNDEERIKLHLAAIFINNFTNHLFSMAFNWCKREHLDFTLFHSMMEETVKRAEGGNPGTVQTGPAVRNDEITIQKHLALLEDYAPMKSLYEQLTRSIQANVKAGE